MADLAAAELEELLPLLDKLDNEIRSLLIPKDPAEMQKV